MKLIASGWGRDHGEKTIAEGDLLIAEIGDANRFPRSQIYISVMVGQSGSIFRQPQEPGVALRFNAQINLNGEYLLRQNLSKEEIGRLFAIAYADSSIEEIAHLFKSRREIDLAKLAEVVLANSVLVQKVERLNLTPRSAACLKNADIVYVGDLVQQTEAALLRTSNFGRKSLNEIKEMVVGLGLHLGMELPGWPPANIEQLAENYGKQM